MKFWKNCTREGNTRRSGCPLPLLPLFPTSKIATLILEADYTTTVAVRPPNRIIGEYAPRRTEFYGNLADVISDVEPIDILTVST